MRFHKHIYRITNVNISSPEWVYGRLKKTPTDTRWCDWQRVHYWERERPLRVKPESTRWSIANSRFSIKKKQTWLLNFGPLQPKVISALWIATLYLINVLHSNFRFHCSRILLHISLPIHWTVTTFKHIGLPSSGPTTHVRSDGTNLRMSLCNFITRLQYFWRDIKISLSITWKDGTYGIQTNILPYITFNRILEIHQAKLTCFKKLL